MHLTHAILDGLCPRWRTEPAAVLDAGQVLACSPLAAQAGVRPGQRAGGVSALCPTASLRSYDAVLHSQYVQDAALGFLQYTPEVALLPSDTVALEVSASLQLFGGIRALCRRVAATARGMGMAARLGVGPTACGAWLLATAPARQPRVLTLPTLARRLDRVPCSRMPEAERHLEWLTGIGCSDLGALRRLPRGALQRRTHAALLQALDRAYGEGPELHTWIEAPPVFAGRIELDENIEHAPDVLAIAQRLVEQLCGWLAAAHLAATRVNLTIEHELGRHACAPTVLDVRLASPAWIPSRMLPLMAEQLNRLTLAAPARAIALQAAQLEPLAPVPTDLFPEAGGSAADRDHVMALLVARLGRDHVLHAHPVADHRPDIANRWVPVDEVASSHVYAVGAVRPSWLLQKPIALLTRGHRPYYGAPLQIVQGPERIEDGWWNGLTVRDYFVAEAPDGSRYWLYQDRDDPSGWFLHGLFG